MNIILSDKRGKWSTDTTIYIVKVPIEFGKNIKKNGIELLASINTEFANKVNNEKLEDESDLENYFCEYAKLKGKELFDAVPIREDIEYYFEIYPY